MLININLNTLFTEKTQGHESRFCSLASESHEFLSTENLKEYQNNMQYVLFIFPNLDL